MSEALREALKLLHAYLENNMAGSTPDRQWVVYDKAMDALAALATPPEGVREPLTMSMFANRADYERAVNAFPGSSALAAPPAKAAPSGDDLSHAMFVARLERAPNELWSSSAVLALMNDCDMLAQREAGRAAPSPVDPA